MGLFILKHLHLEPHAQFIFANVRFIGFYDAVETKFPDQYTKNVLMLR